MLLKGTLIFDAGRLGKDTRPRKLEKKYAPALDNYGQSCFVRSDLKKNEVCL